ncbi:hypothetical protein C0991_000916 [Blastosporella zonata]|nr:hypothetical protein C0991_000916 [Blastosporella zonata]
MSTRKSSQNMTQGTLNFGSIKPKRNAMLNAKSKSKQTKVAPALKNSTSVGSFEIDEIVVPPSLEDEDEPIPKIEKTSKDSDVVEDRGRVLRTRKSAKPSVETIAALRPNPAAENREPPKLNENNPTYIAHYAVVQEKMDHMKPSTCSAHDDL